MSEREGAERLQYAHKCSKMASFSPFNPINASIYSPLSKTSHYGPIVLFLRTRERSAIQVQTVSTRIPIVIKMSEHLKMTCGRPAPQGRTVRDT
jgi:hypothetical protein